MPFHELDARDISTLILHLFGKYSHLCEGISKDVNDFICGASYLFLS